MKKIILTFSIITLFTYIGCSSEIGYSKKYELKIQKLKIAYQYYKNKNYDKAINAFKDYHEKHDSNYYDYETVALLSDSYFKSGAQISGQNNYLSAIADLKVKIDKNSKKITYQKLALHDLEKWYGIYPNFPDELRNLKSEDKLPQPVKGIFEFQNRIKKVSEGSGRVVYLTALIDENGDVLKVVIIKTFSEEAASNSKEALIDTKFTIPKRKGRIAKTWVSIPISFK